MRDAGSRIIGVPHELMWRVLRLLGALSLLATVFILLARQWWFFELFTHFSVQLLAAQLLLLGASLIMRKVLWAVLIAVACVINGLTVRDYVLPGGNYVPDDAAPAQIRVLNANVRSSNADPAALIAVVTAVEPDIIAVLEFTERTAAALAPLNAAYPHQMLAPEPGNFGIAVFSRLPFVTAEQFELSGFAAIDVQIDAEQDWHFIAVHPVPPINADMAALRNRQLDQLGTYLVDAGAPHIVVGDLNMTPFSPVFRDFTAANDLSDALRGRGPQYTWPVSFPLLGIPIDHVLVSTEFEVIDFFHAGDIGSDHFPVIADINPSRFSLD